MHAASPRAGSLALVFLLSLGAFGMLSIANVSPAHAQTLGPWNPTTDYPESNFGSCVVSAGYEYCSTGYYARLSSSGVGLWTPTTPNPLGLFGQACAAYDGYIYCVGGTSGSPMGVTNAVDYAPLSSSGVGAWTNTTDYPDNLYGASCTASLGFLYCVGGDETIGAVETDIVAFAPVSSSGVGAWATTNNYPLQLVQANCAVSGAYIYCVGGDGAADLGYTNLAYFAAITWSSNGYEAVGTWNATTSYPTSDGSGLSPQSCVVTGNDFYCLGGSSNYDGGDTSLVYYAPLSSAGIGQWQNSTEYPTGPGACAAYGAEIDCMTGNSSAFYASVAETSLTSTSMSSTGSSAQSTSTEITSSSAPGSSSTTGSQPVTTISSQGSTTETSALTSGTNAITGLTSATGSSPSSKQSSTQASGTSLGPSFTASTAVLACILALISLSYRSRSRDTHVPKSS